MKAYVVLGMAQPWGQPAAGTGHMLQTGRLQHGLEVSQRATLTLLGDFVLVAFLVLAVGTTAYDVGAWLSLW